MAVKLSNMFQEEIARQIETILKDPEYHIDAVRFRFRGLPHDVRVTVELEVLNDKGVRLSTQEQDVVASDVTSITIQNIDKMFVVEHKFS